MFAYAETLQKSPVQKERNPPQSCPSLDALIDSSGTTAAKVSECQTSEDIFLAIISNKMKNRCKYRNYLTNTNQHSVQYISNPIN